jgi:hypothetical protein
VEPLVAVEVKGPGVMAMEVAPLVTQLSVVLVSEFTFIGLAVNDVIEGAEPFSGFTELVAAAQPVSQLQANRIPPSAAKSSRQKPQYNLRNLRFRKNIGESRRNGFIAIAPAV